MDRWCRHCRRSAHEKPPRRWSRAKMCSIRSQGPQWRCGAMAFRWACSPRSAAGAADSFLSFELDELYTAAHGFLTTIHDIYRVHSDVLYRADRDRQHDELAAFFHGRRKSAFAEERTFRTVEPRFHMQRQLRRRLPSATQADLPHSRQVDRVCRHPTFRGREEHELLVVVLERGEAFSFFHTCKIHRAAPQGHGIPASQRLDIVTALVRITRRYDE